MIRIRGNARQIQRDIPCYLPAKCLGFCDFCSRFSWEWIYHLASLESFWGCLSWGSEKTWPRWCFEITRLKIGSVTECGFLWLYYSQMGRGLITRDLHLTCWFDGKIKPDNRWELPGLSPEIRSTISGAQWSLDPTISLLDDIFLSISC